MDPLEALGRIVRLLESAGETHYKVRAFRRAAEVVAGLEPGRLETLVASGHLTDLEGIGSTTAGVIIQAQRGEVPAYLAELEAAATGTPASEAAVQLRRALRGDCHSHSEWSDGSVPIEEMARAAIGLGHEYLALTDHSPRLTVAHGLNRERLLRQLEVVDELNERLAPFRILRGIEVDILEDGSLDQDDDLLGALDVVVASVHSKLSMDPDRMTARMVAAVEHPHTDILGHCTGRIIVGRGRPPSRFSEEDVFSACARTGTAVEVNSRPERRDPPEPLLRKAASLGCVFSIDSDAHAPGQLEWLSNGCEQAGAVGLTPERVVNTWPAERLLAWTAEGR